MQYENKRTGIPEFMSGKKQGTKKNTLRYLLLAGSIAAAIKCIFVSLQMDEEYAISMSYRMLLGDKMLSQIWDPHQTSAFFIEFLIWLYEKLFHTTTGVVIWIRTAGVLIHGVIAYRVYRFLQSYLSDEDSFYLGILYFNLLPKGYVMPEFSNMMMWALTLLLLSLFRYKRLVGTTLTPQEKKGYPVRLWLTGIESGIWMCLLVLSYPSCVIIFPFILWYLWRQKDYGKRAAGIFAGVCMLAGGLYLLYLFSYMNTAELIRNIGNVLASCESHTRDGAGRRLQIYAAGMGYALLIGMVYLILVAVIYRLTFFRKKYQEWIAVRSREEKGVTVLFLMFITAVVLQGLHWIFMLWKYEYSYIYAFYFFLLAAGIYSSRRLGEEEKDMAMLWLRSSVLMFLAILILTNLTVFASVKYLLPGVIAGMAALLIYTRDNMPEVYRKFAGKLLIIWCFAAIFIKGWAYPDNDGLMKNITCVRNIVSVGPAKGIFTDYMQGYMQESIYEEMQEYVQPGDSLLLLDAGTLPYLYQDVEVASYTTICTPSYDEILLDYWKENPEKYPDVIAVQCWYGELKWDAESWIMEWIEKEYGAGEIIDGKYYRYYIR